MASFKEQEILKNFQQLGYTKQTRPQELIAQEYLNLYRNFKIHYMEIKKNLDCLFCQVIATKEAMVKEKKIYLVGENAEAMAILDKFPVSDGHTLLITKKHFPNISKIEEES
jgi:hypothetical protein